MSILLWHILILWALFVGFTVLLSLINLFHLVHYGFWTFKSALFSLLYYGTVAIILFWAVTQILQLDFNQILFTIGRPNLSLPTSL
ncbi:MAG: hypothetical protein Q7S48_04425 [bacterium]|nr:hypothetical protein [bacterium]